MYHPCRISTDTVRVIIHDHCTSAMEPDLSTPVSALRSQLTRVKNAWAQWRDATSQCAFAAVMGSAVPAALRPSAEWSLDQSLSEDPQYDDSMRSIRMQARRPDCDRLHQAVLAHLGCEISPASPGPPSMAAQR